MVVAVVIGHPADGHPMLDDDAAPHELPLHPMLVAVVMGHPADGQPMLEEDAAPPHEPPPQSMAIEVDVVAAAYAVLVAAGGAVYIVH